ncbi:beta-lactamase-like protein [Rhizoctonia solani]|nr:beta-lactamase-like protein [Rhizoctonia solani]
MTATSPRHVCFLIQVPRKDHHWIEKNAEISLRYVRIQNDAENERLDTIQTGSAALSTLSNKATTTCAMDLPNIQKLSSLVTRVLGQNPGKFTLQDLPQGTNTYLIGRSPPYILIDTGEGKPEYVGQLRKALESSPDGQCPISDIIITHKHMDHHGGLIDVLDFLSSQRSTSWQPPRIHIHPLPAGVTDSSLTATIARLKSGEFTPTSDSGALFALNDGSKVQTADASAMLEIVHTPGHTADSISLILYAMNNAEPAIPEALFTADTVLGAGTAVFEDLASYMQSLRRLVDLPIWSHFISLHPGHGPTVSPESSKSHIETYISHRQARENQIIDVFRKSQGKTSVGQIVESLYAEYPRTLWPAAAHSVGLHLQKLEVEGRARRLGGKKVAEVGEYDGVKMEQVGGASMDAEWEFTEVGVTNVETKL